MNIVYDPPRTGGAIVCASGSHEGGHWFEPRPNQHFRSWMKWGEYMIVKGNLVTQTYSMLNTINAMIWLFHPSDLVENFFAKSS